MVAKKPANTATRPLPLPEFYMPIAIGIPAIPHMPFRETTFGQECKKIQTNEPVSTKKLEDQPYHYASALPGMIPIQPTIYPYAAPLINCAAAAPENEDTYVAPLALYHICRICQRPRSSQYHQEHPIPVNGLPPPPGICRRCRVLSAEEQGSIKVEYEVVKLSESGEVKLGIKSLVTDDDIVTNDEMRRRKIEKLLEKSASQEFSQQNRSYSRSRPPITYRYLRVVDKSLEEPQQFRSKDLAPAGERSKKANFMNSDHHLQANSKATVDPGHDIGLDTAQLERYKSGEGGAENEIQETSTIASRANLSGSYDPHEKLLEMTKKQRVASKFGWIEPDIRRIAQEEVANYGEKLKKQTLTEAEIRSIARDETEQYRTAERKLAAHPHPYAYGKFVPVERRVETCRSFSEADTYEDKAKTSNAISRDKLVALSDLHQRNSSADSIELQSLVVSRQSISRMSKTERSSKDRNDCGIGIQSYVRPGDADCMSSMKENACSYDVLEHKARESNTHACGKSPTTNYTRHLSKPDQNESNERDSQRPISRASTNKDKQSWKTSIVESGDDEHRTSLSGLRASTRRVAPSRRDSMSSGVTEATIPLSVGRVQPKQRLWPGYNLGVSNPTSRWTILVDGNPAVGRVVYPDDSLSETSQESIVSPKRRDRNTNKRRASESKFRSESSSTRGSIQARHPQYDHVVSSGTFGSNKSTDGNPHMAYVCNTSHMQRSYESVPEAIKLSSTIDNQLQSQSEQHESPSTVQNTSYKSDGRQRLDLQQQTTPRDIRGKSLQSSRPISRRPDESRSPRGFTSENVTIDEDLQDIKDQRHVPHVVKTPTRSESGKHKYEHRKHSIHSSRHRLGEGRRPDKVIVRTEEYLEPDDVKASASDHKVRQNDLPSHYLSRRAQNSSQPELEYIIKERWILPVDDEVARHESNQDRVDKGEHKAAPLARGRNKERDFHHARQDDHGSPEDDDGSSRVHFSKNVLISPTPPGSDATSSEFQSFSRSGHRNMRSKSRNTRTSRYAGRAKNNPPRGRSRETNGHRSGDSPDRLQQIRRAGSIDRALSESPSRESYMMYGALPPEDDRYGPYREFDQTTSLEAEDGSSRSYRSRDMSRSKSRSHKAHLHR